MSIRITHIRLANGVRDHEHITDVRWVDQADGKTDTSTTAAIVNWLENQNGVAYVGTGASQVSVGVVKPASGAPYLRTHADGRSNNNLLQLPEF